MSEHLSLVAAWLMCAASIACAQPSPAATPSDGGAAGVTITLLEQKRTDRALELGYQISNQSGRDIWICQTISPDFDFECFIPAGDHRLVVRRRQDVPDEIESYEGASAGTYVRMRPGQTRVERICLPFPVHCAPVYTRRVREHATDAASLVVEIGFYDYDLPEGRLRQCQTITEGF